ncbi:hypothetical protein X975_04298, partial [Stegodyphus mimosarum]
MAMKKCSVRRGIVCWPDLDNSIAEWVQEQRQNCYITGNVIRAYTLKFALANPKQF